LIDFLSVLPEIATTACSKDNTKHRFIEAGIIDKEFNRYPVFNKILATYHQQPILEEYSTLQLLIYLKISLIQWMRRDTLKKSIKMYVALGWTRMSTDKMFSEQRVLHKGIFKF
jgi:hypothetical protein